MFRLPAVSPFIPEAGVGVSTGVGFSVLRRRFAWQFFDRHLSAALIYCNQSWWRLLFEGWHCRGVSGIRVSDQRTSYLTLAWVRLGTLCFTRQMLRSAWWQNLRHLRWKSSFTIPNFTFCRITIKHGKNVLLRQQNYGQQINFLLLQPKISLQQPNVLLIELNILLL